ncbi:MAG TPA: hypothetical protein VGM76_07680 [Lacipirellulaceae bacterium]|jgi:antitoxin (DNA-binding transcriptional repressor) of toxin-antitoxin stability system
MKALDIEQANLKGCLSAAQGEPIVLTQGGAPIALIVRVDGMDEEQIEFGSSADFWKMIQARRRETMITQEELERRLAGSDDK